MQQYIGTKIIKAEPCQAWKQSGEWCIGAEGYKVEYDDGYVSWSPKDQFEKAYRLTSGMPFGLAVEAMKKGLKVARAGWFGCLIIKAENQVYGFVFVTKDNQHQIWLTYELDLLADDWMIVD